MSTECYHSRHQPGPASNTRHYSPCVLCLQKFGKIKDIYLPRDYYTGTPRGFGFVEFFDFRDAEDAQHKMDGRLLDGKALVWLLPCPLAFPMH